MTEPFDEYGERLRRVLHAEAAAVTPSPEGLEQIRAKIAEKRERRFGAWFALSWLRPLAAVAAAIVIAGIAVSATPALKTFVQTGHFGATERRNGGTSVIGGQQEVTVSPPVSTPRSGGATAPHPTAVPRTPSGAHVIPGHRCPDGEDRIAPSAGPADDDQTAGTPPPQHVTCGPVPVKTPPTTDPVTPPVVTTPPPQQPTTEAPDNGGGQLPSAQSSP
jgi:hypothetical protein